MSKRSSPPATATDLLKKLKSLEKQVSQLVEGQEASFLEDDRFVHFLAGRQYFTLLKTTIERYPESLFYRWMTSALQGNKVNGAFIIDRSPKRFSFLVDYMQAEQVPGMTTADQENFKQDCEYFGLPFVEPLSKKEAECKRVVDLWIQNMGEQVKEAEANYIAREWMYIPRENVPAVVKGATIGEEISVLYENFKNVATSMGYPTFTETLFCKILRYIGCTIKNGIVEDYQYIPSFVFHKDTLNIFFLYVTYVYPFTLGVNKYRHNILSYAYANLKCGPLFIDYNVSNGRWYYMRFPDEFKTTAKNIPKVAGTINEIIQEYETEKTFVLLTQLIGLEEK